ncbi:MAG: DUF362 domain-containing protein [Bacilli bacterium]|nr:DUF362 domain-containing protein [Bacilli bacterium]
MAKAKVYFTRKIDGQSPLRLYKALGIDLPGSILAKVHSGEEGNQNYLHPDFWLPIIRYLNATVVECNTAYEGSRNTSVKHLELLRKHGWINNDFPFDLMDEEGPDEVIEIPFKGYLGGKDYVGKHLKNYDSAVVLSHFKGHPMGGYGGALKQLSIGFASSYGKEHIHAGGKKDHSDMWETEQLRFLESMAEAALGIHRHFEGKIAYINAAVNLSVDCDCCSVAEDPCMKDIGILASLDPVALDKACIDLVKASDDPGKEHFLARVDRQQGEHTYLYAAKLGVGSLDYELIDLDK